VRLTSDEITRQYDRYNESENLDEGTQQILGAVLDTIESPAKTAGAPVPNPKE
jgi:hypothetical protein